jgi:hypothetical protein
MKYFVIVVLPDQCNISFLRCFGAVEEFNFQRVCIYIHRLDSSFHSSVPSDIPVIGFKYFLSPAVPYHKPHFRNTKPTDFYNTVYIITIGCKGIGYIQCRHDQRTYR